MPDVPTGGRSPHVVLVGLMGAGKTTVGKKVAKLVGRRFVDADVALVADTGRTIAEWYEREGEAGFRDAEEHVLLDLLRSPDPLVIGAGGGVVVREANRERLGQPDVVVIYLHGDPHFLASRVQAKEHRPILRGVPPEEVLVPQYEQRDPWYRGVADAVVEVRPAHEAGTKPKWRLAEQVVEQLLALRVVDRSEVSERAQLDAGAAVADPGGAS